MSRPTLVYDGDCGFCSTCARFVNRRIPTPAEVVAWQHTDLGALGLTAARCEEAVQWVDGEITASGADALGRMLLSAGRPWRVLGRALLLPPVLALARPVYRLVSRHRDKLPGGTAMCALPQEERDRLR
ncbi:MAG TPA: DCC1-like thiol-disulfide oxidoreductase family protein [Mycobacteriales bacterium]|jgi:predicted DCC family thiol-disulfide oxidoreductase YuxK|nr:DCC1-like thiol-disulfide oxidoreductase family protein [Mycobacteriales bacterium]